MRDGQHCYCSAVGPKWAMSGLDLGGHRGLNTSVKGCAPCPQECAGASRTLATPPSGIALRQVSLANISPLSLGPAAPPHSAEAGHPLHLW